MMENNLFTVEQVAARLDLHPKTIRRFIRAGTLKARKAGKQWRISAADLEDFMGRNKPETGELRARALWQAGDSAGFAPRDEGPIQPKVRVSAVVDIMVADKEEAIRLTNTLFAVMNCKDPSYGSSRCDHVFYPEEMKARYILWGTPRFMTDILNCLAVITENKENDE